MPIDLGVAAVIFERARRADVQAELLRQFTKYRSGVGDAMVREHFADTPLYIETALQTGVMPARVRIVRQQVIPEDTGGILSLTWREGIVEDELPPREPAEFCESCTGPHGGWLEQYGGHWDTCPNAELRP